METHSGWGADALGQPAGMVEDPLKTSESVISLPMWDQQTCSYKHVAMMVWLVRPPIRVPILPLEVRKHIIDLLAEDLYKVTEVGATFHALRMCSLTCRSLLKAARRHLFKRVVLSQPRHLASLASSHSDVFPHVVGLTAHDTSSSASFVHLVPRYLGSKLPNLQHLHLGGFPTKSNSTDKQPTFTSDPSFPIFFSQFRSVTSLTLSNFRFSSFLDLRRVVGAIPNLNSLFLMDITWGKRHDWSSPLLRATQWKLTKLTMWGCQLNSNGLWFWAVPPEKAQDDSYHGLGDSMSHPGLSPSDIYIISEVLERLIPGDQGKDVPKVLQDDITFTWVYDIENGHGHLTCACRGTDTITLTLYLRSSVSAPHKQHLCLAEVESIQISLPLHVNWEQIDWGGVDSNIAKLQGLKGVGLVIPWQTGNHRFSGRTIDEQMNIVRSVNEMSGLPGANSGITQTFRGYFPLIQNRCRLQIRYQEIKV